MLTFVFVRKSRNSAELVMPTMPKFQTEMRSRTTQYQNEGATRYVFGFTTALLDY